MQSALILMAQTVYITRVVLDSANGVSSTRWAEVAAINFLEGEIRQIQFVGDGTVMLLWSCDRMSSVFSHYPPVLML